MVSGMMTLRVGFQAMVEEEDSMAHSSSHESSLQLDPDSFSSRFDSQQPDKAVFLVRSVLTQRRQALQVTTPYSSSAMGTGV